MTTARKPSFTKCCLYNNSAPQRSRHSWHIRYNTYDTIEEFKVD